MRNSNGKPTLADLAHRFNWCWTRTLPDPNLAGCSTPTFSLERWVTQPVP